MKSLNIKKEKRDRRHAKIRTTLSGTTICPRLSVFKSNKHISVQLIDDSTARTLASVHSRDVKAVSMLDKSKAVGIEIAKKALAQNISKVVFDRGGFKYTGCVKMLADSAREAGLVF
jgi:large subunit ribosomal protein L18